MKSGRVLIRLAGDSELIFWHIVKFKVFGQKSLGSFDRHLLSNFELHLLPYLRMHFLEIAKGQKISEIIYVQGVLCLRYFLRLWKNNRVSRKPLDKWEYQNKPCYLENRVVREPCKQRTACINFIFCGYAFVYENKHALSELISIHCTKLAAKASSEKMHQNRRR